MRPRRAAATNTLSPRSASLVSHALFFWPDIDPTLADVTGMAPIHVAAKACVFGASLAGVNCLHCCFPRGNLSRLLVYLPCFRGNTEACRLLLEKGADVNMRVA